MLQLVIFFLLGVGLGMVGLRLIAHWENAAPGKSRFGHWRRGAFGGILAFRPY